MAAAVAAVEFDALAKALYLALIFTKSAVPRIQFANNACLKRLSMAVTFAMGTFIVLYSSIYASVAMSFFSRSISVALVMTRLVRI